MTKKVFPLNFIISYELFTLATLSQGTDIELN